ncbi:hypothetical protein MASR2M36_27640 [Providencia sp.]
MKKLTTVNYGSQATKNSCSRIQLIGLTRYIKSDIEGEKGNNRIVNEVSVDKLRKQPGFVKDQQIGAG